MDFGENQYSFFLYMTLTYRTVCYIDGRDHQVRRTPW